MVSGLVEMLYKSLYTGIRKCAKKLRIMVSGPRLETAGSQIIEPYCSEHKLRLRGVMRMRPYSRIYLRHSA
jgi:hypothetical protein